MVFTFWVFYATILFFICYMFLMAFEKGKKMLSKEKLMDQIEEKSEVLINFFFILRLLADQNSVGY